MSTPHRPGYLTLLTVLGVVQGVIGLGLATFVIVDRNDTDLLNRLNDSELADGHQITPNLLLAMGIIGLIVSVAIILIAVGLGRGNNAARYIFAFLLVANVAQGLYSLVALDGEQQMTGAFSLAFSLFTLWFLFSSTESTHFFEHGHHAEPTAR